LAVFMDNPGNSIEFELFPLDNAVRVNLRPPIIMFSGMVLGPLGGLLTGGLVDIISFKIWHSNLNYLFVLTLITMLRGFLSGYIFNIIFYRLNLKSVFAAVSIPYFIVSGFAVPFILFHYYNVPLMNNILLRLSVQFFTIPLYTVTSYLILKGMKNTYDMKKMLKIDDLTGLFNRKYFLEFMRKMISLAQRKNHLLSIIMLDLDKFKIVNDTYGHNVGDQVLMRVGEVLQKEMREEDVVARIGGEEFAILLMETSLKEAVNIAERIKEKIAAMTFSHSQEINITASFGVTELKAGDKLQNLLIKADQALYVSKKEGRNRVSVKTVNS
ncbi:MAG: GGDEF domain-containing protein, partial [Halanaerobiales bacterium]